MAQNIDDTPDFHCKWLATAAGEVRRVDKVRLVLVQCGEVMAKCRSTHFLYLGKRGCSDCKGPCTCGCKKAC